MPCSSQDSQQLKTSAENNGNYYATRSFFSSEMFIIFELFSLRQLLNIKVSRLAAVSNVSDNNLDNTALPVPRLISFVYSFFNT